MSIFIKKN